MLEVQYKSVKLPVLTHDKGDFSSVNHSRVLIYFPHGAGDWVHFSHVLPYLEQSNRYFMTRFGDDGVALMDGSSFAVPFYTGIKSTHCGDGESFGIRHFGLEYGQIDGSAVVLKMPLALFDQCIDNRIDAVLFTSFPETWGTATYPFHTKARKMLSHLAPNLDQTLLDRPLTSAISFNLDRSISAWVESRLRTYGGFGERKLCIIGRAGYTSVDKNWGHIFREVNGGKNLPEGEECRDFIRLMLKRDPGWMFLAIEDRLYEGEHTVRSKELNCLSYAELFGTPDDAALPFGLIAKALINLADLSVGVPAGPFHLSMVKPELPTVGIWIDHVPSWYDEPKLASIHVISRNTHDKGYWSRVGSIRQCGEIEYRQMEVNTQRISGEQVIAAVEELL